MSYFNPFLQSLQNSAYLGIRPLFHQTHQNLRQHIDSQSDRLKWIQTHQSGLDRYRIYGHNSTQSEHRHWYVYISTDELQLHEYDVSEEIKGLHDGKEAETLKQKFDLLLDPGQPSLCVLECQNFHKNIDTKKYINIVQILIQNKMRNYSFYDVIKSLRADREIGNLFDILFINKTWIENTSCVDNCDVLGKINNLANYSRYTSLFLSKHAHLFL